MATHRYPIRKGKYEALSKKELAMAIEKNLEGESTDEEYKEYEKRMKDDQKLNEFLGEDDGTDTEFIPSKTSRPDLNNCSDSETSSDAEEGNFDKGFVFYGVTFVLLMQILQVFKFCSASWQGQIQK